MDIPLSNDVGINSANPSEWIRNAFRDQIIVSTLVHAVLPANGGAFGQLMPLLTDLEASKELSERIATFQQFWVAVLNAEDVGVVRRHSATLAQLLRQAVPGNLPPGFFDSFNVGNIAIQFAPQTGKDGTSERSEMALDPFSIVTDTPVWKMLTVTTTIRLVGLTQGNSRFWFGVARRKGAQTSAAHTYFFILSRMWKPTRLPTTRNSAAIGGHFTQRSSRHWRLTLRGRETFL